MLPASYALHVEGMDDGLVDAAGPQVLEVAEVCQTLLRGMR